MLIKSPVSKETLRRGIFLPRNYIFLQKSKLDVAIRGGMIQCKRYSFLFKKGKISMPIISMKFYMFLVTVLIVYYLFPLSKRWITLLMASTAFIVMGSSWRLYLFFVFQTISAYYAAYLIRKFPNKGKLFCRLSVIFQIGALTIWKENSFFIINLRLLYRVLKINREIPYLNLIAPMAMSYYTLMLVSYILDVYWEKIEPEKKPLKLLLYAGFFPQMISGPITRYGETGHCLFEGHKFEYRTFCFGCQRILWGFFKKLVLAERLSILVNTIYTGGLHGTWTPTGTYVLIGMLAYVFQVYTDFSGSMDIVLGVAQLFGIRLPENFETPFYATSLSEFWRRWHMTLGLWAKEYIMYPFLKSEFAGSLRHFCKKTFGKKAAKKLPTYMGTFLVWSYCGFWHGGSYRWIAWGLMTFAVIVGGMLMQPVFDKLKALLKINTNTASYVFFQRIRTALLFMFTVSVQPADSLRTATAMWKHLFVINPWVLLDGSLYTLGLDRIDFWIMIYGLGLLFVISMYHQKGSVREMIAAQNLVFRWLLWILLFVAVLLFGMYGEGYDAASFIYGGF